MKMKIVLAVVSVALAVSAGLVVTGMNFGAPEDRIRAGWISGLTGPAADFGLPALNAADIAVREINKAGGISGKRLELIAEDGKCDPREANVAARKLITVDKVSVILGGHCSPETLAAAPIAEANKVILFASVSTSPDITHAGDYIFRNSPVNTRQSELVAELARNRLNMTKIAVISEQTSYARPIAVALKKEFERLGGTVTNFEEFPSDRKDFRDSLAKIRASEPDAVFISTQTQDNADLIVKQLHELGIDAQLFGNEVAGSNIAIQKYGDLGEGLIFGEPELTRNEHYLEFEDKYKQRYGVDEVPFELWTAESYDAVHLIAEALESCGQETECIKDFLYGVENWTGASGKISIDENGDGLRNYVLKQIRNGTAVAYLP